MPRKSEPRCTTEQQVFPSRLRELMEKRGVNQKELAAIIGMRPQTVSLYTGGQSTPDINCLRKIAEYFRVSADWLIGLADPDNSTADEKLRMVSECTRLSNQAILRLDSISGTVAYGNRTLNELIAHPKFYEFISYLGTYFYGEYVEEFTGKEQGFISELKLIKNDDFFKRYIQPSMLSKIFEILTEMKSQIEDGSDE